MYLTELQLMEVQHANGVSFFETVTRVGLVVVGKLPAQSFRYEEVHETK